MNTKQQNSERDWHDNFRQYTEEIVNHPNYKGLLYKRNENGDVQWVVTGKSEDGKLRQAWWDNQCQKNGITIKKGCYAAIARLIHPTKIKVCQCCGKKISILYEYPNKNLLRKINSHFDIQLEQTSHTIKEIIEAYCNNYEDIQFFVHEFKLSDSILQQTNSLSECKNTIIDEIYTEYVNKCLKPLSPGAMSNCPDRFDGFHSDGLCCREKTDKGRHHENMMTYTQDRRAYEEWADGNFNLANRLMGEFRKDRTLHRCPKCGNMRRMTADHIGPISLGFCHSIHFAPMCDSCNSSKNNRFTFDDVKKLLEFEDHGETVVSWHSKPIWDNLKFKIKNDDDAKKLSFVMIQCHHNILKLFSTIYAQTGRAYLSRFLHPEYAFYDYRFDNFDAFDLSKLIIKEEPLDSANKQSNSERYIRIAFESLQEFGEKDNRKTSFVAEKFKNETNALIELINANKYTEADKLLFELICNISHSIEQVLWE